MFATLTDEERTQLEAERRGSHAFRVRRAQIVLASARGLSSMPIAQVVGCAVQTVRNVIHAFHAHGLACVPQQSTRPKRVTPTLDATNCERLQHILHQSPRTYGQPTGVWTLALAAEVCYAQGVTERLLRDATIRRALKPGGAGVAQGAQPACQAGRRLPCGRMPLADQESLAQSDRTEMGAWQASYCRTRTAVAC